MLATAALAADKVTVQLDWVVRGNHAMFFVAKEKGYFAEAGIDVTAIRRGTGSPNAMRLVGNGNAEFGFGDLPTLAVARSQDVPVVALVAVNQHSPLGMLALASKHKLHQAAGSQGAQHRRAAVGLDLRVPQGVPRGQRHDARRHQAEHRQRRPTRTICCSAASMPCPAISMPRCRSLRPRPAGRARSRSCRARISAIPSTARACSPRRR